MPKTNPREEQVLNFIREFSTENGYAPSIREICAGVGLRSTASVNYHLKNLQQKGLLTLGEKGRKRAIAAPQRPGQIPLIGTVTAGLPILAMENREGTISWDGDPACFALRVRGDSMINAGIFSGDVVVVRPSPPQTTVRLWWPGWRMRPPSSACAAATGKSGSCRKTRPTPPSTAPTPRLWVW